jgi:hypothetical protein
MHNSQHKFSTAFAPILSVALLVLLVQLPPSRPSTAKAQAATGTIAYIRADTLDEIRLIEPDGSNDRLLWAVPQADPQNVYHISGLAWKPDATELVFAGSHENYCSLYDQDLYAIHPDGSGYRRITNGPTCAELAGYPQGRVKVKVSNTGFSAKSIFVYFQGAAEPRPLSLPPLGKGEVTFDAVADLGAGPQFAAGIESAYRWINAASADVQPGALVETAPLLVSGADTVFAAYRPSWHSDGTKLAFAFSHAAFQQIEANPPLGAQGTHLFTATQLPIAVGPAYYAPVAARSNELIYFSWDSIRTAIFHVTEGSTDGGTPLAAPNWDEYIQYGQTWLPDGSGFLYATRSMFGGSKLLEYNFAAGSATLIAQFDNYVAAPSVSPDGQQIVFERGNTMDQTGTWISDPDLWIMNRDGSEQQLFVENARLPAWSLQNPTTPPATPTPLAPQPTTTPAATPTATTNPQATPASTPVGQPRIYLPSVHR